MTDGHRHDAIHDDARNSRFVLQQDGATAELVYDREPGRLILLHTEVPEALGGRGIGGQLVRAAVDQARAENLTVVPWCPFARRQLADHPEVAADLTVDWTTPRSSP